MRALDLRHVEESGCIADQQTAGERQLRQRLETAFRQGTRTVRNATATFQIFPNCRMRFIALELLIRREPRVLVIEADHKTHRDHIVFEVIQERPAVSVRRHRPAHSVDDQTRLMLLGRHLPQFLDTDRIGLWIDAITQIKFLEEFLGQRTTAAFGKDRLLGMEFHAWLVVAGLLAILTDTEVARGDAFDRTVFVVEHLGSGEAGVDFHAQRFGLFAQPTTHLTQTDDVITFVMHLRRCRQLAFTGLGQKQETIFLGFRDQRRAHAAPFRQQLVEHTGLNDRTGQDVGAHFRAFFQQANADVATRCRGPLLQTNRCSQTGRAGADDNNVILHRFAVSAHGVSSE